MEMASGKRSLMLTALVLMMTVVMLPARVKGGPALPKDLPYKTPHSISKLGPTVPYAGFVLALVFRGVSIMTALFVVFYISRYILSSIMLYSKFYIFFQFPQPVLILALFPTTMETVKKM